ncbi:ABC transporter glutamine-binding protein GlnH precursor [Streptomyces netropsis]|uniref:Glutamate transport system substrate-binding protein n=1 Tax=Streptomyces syringium TaxID=76729 RepID=A0ABS4YCJ0_9ACTN|nr:glutamate ABC transporter substrate-binding protein [Streptomyces syringium]MBP2406508.1 glutamate transport system substrate-binding protein [Streptomyces syringium]SPE63597.1 ABC transporter glutamine-binding protein GlnH precursor [Streptomyces netropsis]
MRSGTRSRSAPALATVTVLLTLAAVVSCGRGGVPPGSVAAMMGAGENGITPSAYPVNRSVTVEGSPTLTRAEAARRIVIGVKSDHPFLGFEDPVTGRRFGFDVEIARMVAADLGFGPGRISWKTVPPQGRETAISKGDVDFYVAAYTINDERKKHVSFAGPYYVAGQDLLVKQGNRDIKGPGDLKGKRVCSVTGSTPFQRIEKPEYGAEVSSHDSYAQCVQDLISGEADAVTADDTILKGYAAQNGGRLRVVGRPFSQEPYGVGLAKGDKALRGAVNDALERHRDNGDWQRAYDATLGLSGARAPKPPEVIRY